MKTLTVATLKGGNAKTTTSLAIAAVLAEKGHAVVLVDADPQAVRHVYRMERMTRLPEDRPDTFSLRISPPPERDTTPR